MIQAAPAVAAKPCIVIACPLRSLASLSAGEATRYLAAVDHIHMSVEVGGVIGGEKREQRRDFLRLRVTSQRNLLVYCLQHLVGVFSALHRSQNITRRYGIHPHRRCKL